MQYINIYHIGTTFFCEHRGWSRQLKAHTFHDADQEVRASWKGSEPIKVYLVYNEPLNR